MVNTLSERTCDGEVEAHCERNQEEANKNSKKSDEALPSVDTRLTSVVSFHRVVISVRSSSSLNEKIQTM